MARKGKMRSRTYARPTITGNQTMSFDLAQVKFNASLASGASLTPNKIRSILGLSAADALKITSIIVAPWIESHITPSTAENPNYVYDKPYVIDFADGQRMVAADKAKPTKCVPSKLSPAGRWNDASSTTALVKIEGPYSGSSTANYYFSGSVIVNVAIRQDSPVSTAQAP